MRLELRRGLVLVAVVGSLLAVGCGGGSDGPRERFCDAGCRASIDCGELRPGSFDLCFDRCIGELEGVPVDPSTFEVLAECIETAECSEDIAQECIAELEMEMQL